MDIRKVHSILKAREAKDWLRKASEVNDAVYRRCLGTTAIQCVESDNNQIVRILGVRTVTPDEGMKHGRR